MSIVNKYFIYLVDCAFEWGIAADDSGAQLGEFIRHKIWAETTKPNYVRLCDRIHRREFG